MRGLILVRNNLESARIFFMLDVNMLMRPNPLSCGTIQKDRYFDRFLTDLKFQKRPVNIVLLIFKCRLDMIGDNQT
jgi:hypothetical protein